MVTEREGVVLESAEVGNESYGLNVVTAAAGDAASVSAATAAEMMMWCIATPPALPMPPAWRAAAGAAIGGTMGTAKAATQRRNRHRARPTRMDAAGRPLHIRCRNGTPRPCANAYKSGSWPSRR
jgi:hypothetical protein